MREGGCSTERFARYQRSEQALFLTVMETAINGVSTRTVTRITEEFCGHECAAATVVEMRNGLDPLYGCRHKQCDYHRIMAAIGSIKWRRSRGGREAA